MFPLVPLLAREEGMRLRSGPLRCYLEPGGLELYTVVDAVFGQDALSAPQVGFCQEHSRPSHH